MVERKSDSDYAKKFAEKRKASRFVLDFYHDDEIEKQVHEALKAEPKGSAKKLVMQLLKEHYSI